MKDAPLTALNYNTLRSYDDILESTEPELRAYQEALSLNNLQQAFEHKDSIFDNVIRTSRISLFR